MSETSPNNVLTLPTGAPRENGGGNGGNGSLEARVARLESDVAHINDGINDIKTDIRDVKKEAREDFRILAGLIIIATLGLAGLLARGFHWL